ncbi:MAG TPA: glycosyltransferase family 9 protein [Candidatus Limnocylindrales bacterium]|nr:glycosyltransferase family 9 protein [Candidatus Limnocylindrales bacterium]
MPTPKRILVARLGAIGDCLRVLPAVVRLRAAFPDAEIGWVIGDLARPLFEGHPAIDRLHVVRRHEMKGGPLAALGELRRVGGELAAVRYDVAIDFHTRLKSGVLAFASRAPRRIGFDRKSGGEANFLFTNEHVRLEDHYENRVLRFQRLLVPLGLECSPRATGIEAALWIPPAAAAVGARIYEEAGRPEVAIFAATSGARSYDRWPAERWRDVASRLADANVRSMVLWGPGEMEMAGAIAGGTGGCAVAPPTTLAEMMALLGHFRLYVGSNTAALHMAWMQKVASVVLVGGRPWRTDRPLAPVPSIMLSAGGAEPSRKLRGTAAQRAIEGVEVDEVVAAALKLLAP